MIGPKVLLWPSSGRDRLGITSPDIDWRGEVLRVRSPIRRRRARPELVAGAPEPAT
jgi:hypothetical protein